MTGKTFRGMGWSCVLLCAGTCNTTGKAAKTDVTAPYLGMWTTTTASAQTNCGGNVSDVLGTTVTWSAGSYSGHIQATLVGKCVLDAKVNGNTATAADQTCYDNGITYVVGGTFALQPDGSARLNEHARVTGNGVNCTATLTGPFQKYVP